jgi:ribose transport system permease protein
MRQIFRNYSRELSIGIAIALMTLIFGLINPIYVSADNLIDIINQAIIYGLMAAGMTGIIVIGGIDLSVGSALALIAICVSSLTVLGLHPILCVVAGLLIGLILGGINGVLVAKLKLQPFIATLGTMSIYRGVAFLLVDARPVLNVPMAYRLLVDGKIVGFLRISVILFLLFAFILHIVLKKTRLGSYVYAIGGNEEAARLSGVKVDKTKITIFSIGMLGTALAAIIQVGKLGVGDSTTGTGYELDAIAAVAIGGTSMAGGRGTIIGTFLGAVLFAGLKVGMIVAGVSTFWQYVARGLVILLAAYIEIAQSNISLKKITKS